VIGTQLKTKVALDFEKQDLWSVEVMAAGTYVNKDFLITKTVKVRNYLKSLKMLIKSRFLMVL
jgi:hypothetical protein